MAQHGEHLIKGACVWSVYTSFRQLTQYFRRDRNDHGVYLQVCELIVAAGEVPSAASTSVRKNILQLACVIRCRPPLSSDRILQVSKGQASTWAADLLSLKGHLLRWILPVKAQVQVSDATPFSKAFDSNVAGLLLCPVHLDWFDDG